MLEFKAEANHYTLEKLVGEGQTASVYRAVREDSQRHSSQTVALKILKNPSSVPWLQREFEVLSRVDSAHCVRVLGWENFAGQSALVLEWIEGVTLLELAQRAEISEELCDELIAQTQMGLSALHAAGLHHGDLSPANLLIDSDGRLRILDFASERPGSGVIFGTPAYLTPELWQGESSSMASDLFSLGLIAMDLRRSFYSLPISHEECRERAAKNAVAESDLLSTDPAKRTMRALRSKTVRRATLGEHVQRILLERAQSQVRTAVLPKQKSEQTEVAPFRLARRAAAAMVILAAAAFPAPFGYSVENARSTGSSRLILRAQNWLELTLNGRYVGYAPFDIQNLAPGMHRLSWKNKAATGELLLDLHSGEVRELNESDLSKPGKH